MLAKAVDQPTCSVTGIPPSRASPLPHWGMRRPLLRRKARQFQPHSQTRSFTPIKNVGAGLPAKAVDQPTCSVTGIPLSRASPLPHWGMRRPLLRCNPAIPTARPNAKLHTDQKCGSGLAREGGGSEPAKLADPPPAPPSWRRSNVGASSHIESPTDSGTRQGEQSVPPGGLGWQCQEEWVQQ